MKLQTSTALTELILVIGNPIHAEKILEQEQPMFISINQLMHVQKSVKDLSKHLEYTKQFWLRNRTEEDKPSLEKKKSGVYLAIHSLSLHMHAFLYKVQDLENKFQIDESEAVCVEKIQKDDLDALPPYEDVRQQLKVIKAELDSCQGCWEEAVARVDRKYCVNPDDDDVRGNNTQPQDEECSKDEFEPQMLETKKMPIILSEIDEPVVQDEVFEAFIEEEYSAKDYRHQYDDDLWSADAKKRRLEMKTQKKQGKLVLNELQPILLQRREMWEKRETAALKRQQVRSF